MTATDNRSFSADSHFRYSTLTSARQLTETHVS